MSAFGPHAAQPTAYGGLPPEEATVALVLVHGRGGSAEDILARERRALNKLDEIRGNR